MRARRLVITALTAGAVALGTTAAFAAGPPYKVTVGSNTSGTYTFKAETLSTIPFQLRHAGAPSNYASFVCTKATLTGQVTAGPSRNPVLTVPGSTWSGCTLPGSELKTTHLGTWQLTGTGTNATTGLQDTVAGRMNGFGLEFTTLIMGSSCTFRIGSSPLASFTETNSASPLVRQKIAMTDPGFSTSLRVTQASAGCAPLVVGDQLSMDARFEITSAPAGPIYLS